MVSGCEVRDLEPLGIAVGADVRRLVRAEYVHGGLAAVQLPRAPLRTPVQVRLHGTIDEWPVYILEEIAKWYAVASEGIYGTRPWRIFGEGDSKVIIDGFKEVAVPWNSSDYRFTSKGKDVYAFMMRAPESRVAVIKSFTPDEKVSAVKLLGGDELPFSQSFGVLTVKLPEKLPTEYTNCLKITLE